MQGEEKDTYREIKARGRGMDLNQLKTPRIYSSMEMVPCLAAQSKERVQQRQSRP
jgi:hypothetical protein